MTEPANGNYCLECDANNGDCNDAYKYAKDANQLRDSMIGYGKRTIHYENEISIFQFYVKCARSMDLWFSFHVMENCHLRNNSRFPKRIRP